MPNNHNRFTRDHALAMLRPDIASYTAHGIPTEAEITTELTRLNNLSDRDAKEPMQRFKTPPNTQSIRDDLDDLIARVQALESRRG
jgi:hypothetical protein